jgi:hypothetical protein
LHSCKKDLLDLSSLYVYLSVSISSAPIGWIFVKFDIGDFYENLLTKHKFG